MAESFSSKTQFEPRCELCGNTEAHIYANVGGHLSCGLTKLDRLDKLGESWEGSPPTVMATTTARALLARFCELEIGPSCIVPTNEGGIDFTWSHKGDSEGITLSIDPEGSDNAIGLWSSDADVLTALVTGAVQPLVRAQS